MSKLARLAVLSPLLWVRAVWAIDCNVDITTALFLFLSFVESVQLDVTD